MADLLGVVVSALSALIFGNYQPVSQVEYNCEPLKWIDAPTVANNHFTGTLEDNCRVKAISGGGFIDLKKATEANLVKEAETIHSGPTKEKYAGMESVLYDLTLYAKDDKMELRMRGDNHVATDEKTRLVNAFFSKEVKGTGLASYLRQSTIYIDVRSTKDPEWYTVRVVGAVKVEKPWFLGESTFKNEMVKQIEKQVKKEEPKVATEIAENL